MLLKTKGIVLHTIRYGETSIICRIYTEHKGLRSYIINGARSSKASIKAALFQPPSILDLVVYDKESANLNRVKEVKPWYIYQSLPYEIVKSSLTLFLLEVINKILYEEEHDVELYGFLEETLVNLDEIPPAATADFHLIFLVKLSRYLGFYPSDNYSTERPFFDLREGVFTAEIPPHPEYISEPLSAQFFNFLFRVEEGNDKQLNRYQRDQLLEKLLIFYRIHRPQFGVVKSLKVLKEVFS